MKSAHKTKWISRTIRLPEGLPTRAIALAKTRGLRSLNALVLDLLERELATPNQVCAHCPYDNLIRALRAVVNEPEPRHEAEVRGFMCLDAEKRHAPPASPARPRRRPARRAGR